MSAHPLPRLALLALNLAVALPLQAGGASQTPKTERRPPARVSFIDAPSSETPAAREKRLKRECRGRPNAGACLGHTR
ncbi:hypothetical protein [Hydrogenophaga flava]|uniref:hypothetical protein n=1 Tax=Hydrogenophaga flava TaxID=65657 RepID=UPI000826FB69|nr:hypothetical protein [Hydrogenophaga flava]